MTTATDDEDDRPLRVALLSYRSKPHCGGQGIYLRHVSRELAALGHHVEVFSGQPYLELEPGPQLRTLPSLDLYRDEDPFRTPKPGEYRDWIDVLEVAMMWTASFPEPLTFSIRALRALRARCADFDIVHDNQVLAYGMLGIPRLGLPLVTSIHHPISVDRRIELAQARGWSRLTKRRWYSFWLRILACRHHPRLRGGAWQRQGDPARGGHPVVPPKARAAAAGQHHRRGQR